MVTSEYDTGEQVVVARLGDEGFSHLVCECYVYKRKQWCSHVEFVYKHDTVSHSIEPTPAIVVFVDPWLIVPLVVTSDPGDKFAEVRVVWGNARRTMSNGVEAEGGDTIGYLQLRKQNRTALRRLLLEWLPAVPTTYADKMLCEAATHVQGESPVDIWLDVGEDPERHGYPIDKKRLYTDAYHLLDTGKCAACDHLAYIDLEEVKLP